MKKVLAVTGPINHPGGPSYFKSGKIPKDFKEYSMSPMKSFTPMESYPDTMDTIKESRNQTIRGIHKK